MATIKSRNIFVTAFIEYIVIHIAGGCLMALFNNLPGTLRKMFDEGLDEVLIFVIIFIIILLSENESDIGENLGIAPILIIGVFLLIFAGVCRDGDRDGDSSQI